MTYTPFSFGLAHLIVAVIDCSAVYKVSGGETLSPLMNLDNCSTLVLNRTTLDDHEELDLLTITSMITSLIIMDSCLREPNVSSRILHRDPGYIPCSFLKLTTLSLDASSLSFDILINYQLPALTTFEIIPDSLGRENQDLLIEAVLSQFPHKYPSLKKIILPFDIWLNNNTCLPKNSQLCVEVVNNHDWNWLRNRDEKMKARNAEESE